MSIMNANSAMVCIGTPPCAFSPSKTQNHLKLSSAARHSVERSIPSRPCLPDFIHPMSIFLIALAAAVTLWGFAYKLSLYEPSQSNSSHSSVAKMWLGPERQLGVITNPATKPHFWPAPTPQPNLNFGALPPMSSWQARWTLPETVSVPTGSSLLVGSRSPPSHVLLMQNRVVA
jgi:hypothetical protein